jgi:hypothetical protein
MVTRRAFLGGAAGSLLLASAPRAAVAQAPAQALQDSDLIYLTPLRGDGSESRCQAEVWFVYDGADIFVVTATGAWRARAIRQSRDRARIWVGDLGNWQRTDGAYRSLPVIEGRGELVADADVQAAVLDRFADKYPISWFRWGPRFRNGLADGSRVMLRYRPLG